MLQMGKNVVQMPTGSYRYEYTACGIKFTDKITIPSGKVLRILTCKTTKIIIKNYTLKEAPGTGLTLRLTGPVNYTFNLTQSQEKLSVQQGVYEYTLRGCAGKLNESGRLKFDTPQYRWSIHCPP